MGRSRYKIYEEVYPYFMTSSVVNWEPIFREEYATNIILDAFSFLQTHREVRVYAYVIMEDHIHFIALGKDLTGKVRLFKSFTARKIIDYLMERKEYYLLEQFEMNDKSNNEQSKFQLWQEGVHPKQIVGDNMMLQKIDYIHNNPVKAGYVNEARDWRYSSIHNYLNRQVPIPISCYRR